MAEFNFDNLAKNLPDCYKKDKGSNNYNILEIERTAGVELRNTLNEIAEALNINNASGAVLDAYGERFGQPRGRATDEQYRVMIKSKIARSLSNGSYCDVVDAVCASFGCSYEDVLLLELPSQLAVSVERVPLKAIIGAGFSSSQAYSIIKGLLPAGISLSSISIEGTFEFSNVEDEYDEAAGFAISEENQTIGGYLGATEGDVTDIILPI